MNIWLPIVTNLIIAMILIVGAIVGSRNGWRFELGKLIIMLGVGVGCYFLNPIVVNLLGNIDVISAFPIEIVTGVSFLLLYIVAYIITCITIAGIRVLTGKKVVTNNGARRVKVKGLDKAATRQLRKEEREFRKQQKQLRVLSKKSKVFGAIFGVLIALVVGFVLMLPIKATFNHIAKSNEKLEQINTGYDYTIYGQIDKLVDVSNLIIED